jgi:hypothetical protein
MLPCRGKHSRAVALIVQLVVVTLWMALPGTVNLCNVLNLRMVTQWSYTLITQWGVVVLGKAVAA